MGLKKDNVRQNAEEFYIENFAATQADVALLYQVTEKTLGGWVKKYEWETKRLNFHSSPVKIKQLLQHELLSVAQGNTPKLPADGISKLMAALDRCEKKADPIVVHKILKDLDVFSSKIDPEFAKKATPFHKAFLRHRIDLEA